MSQDQPGKEKDFKKDALAINFFNSETCRAASASQWSEPFHRDLDGMSHLKDKCLHQ